MRRTLIFLIVVSLFINLSAQKSTIFIATNVPVEYMVYIDSQIQFFHLVNHIKIMNVSSGEKLLQLNINTPSHQKPTLKINIASTGEQYYLLDRENDKYYIRKSDKETVMKKGYFSLAGFIPKRISPKSESIAQYTDGCKVKDSSINHAIKTLNDLPNVKARQTYLKSYFNRKCLTTEQIKSLGNGLNDDESRLLIYQNFYESSFDRENYSSVLTKTFKAGTYINQFSEWIKTQAQ